MADHSKQDEYLNNGQPRRQDQFHADDTHENVLEKVRTAGSISIPPDLFEKLYLSPETRVKGDLRKTFGNPTPIGLAGFLLCLTPLSCDLMGFRGPGVASGKGSSDIAVYMFFGGILMNFAGFLELVLGNTYISVVFMTFGCFWLSFGGTLQPFFGAYAAYAYKASTSSDTGLNPASGLDAPAFNSSFAFFLLFMGLLTAVFTICALRTNLILFFVLWPLPFAFCFLAAAFFYTGNGDASYAMTMQTTGGAFAFVTCMFGWYLFTAQMFAAIDLPIQLPVFDLSTKVKGASDRRGKQFGGEAA